MRATGSIVSLTTKASGAGANYAMTLTTQSTSSPAFNPPSFAASTSGPALTGGTGGYGFALLYAPNGNLLAANDSANGNWTYTYDDFNRLTGSACSLHCPDAQNTQGFSYVYDRYANRWQQNVTAGSGYTSSLSFSGNNNRMDGYSYDASGNLLNDGTHSYAYDAESRIISVDNGATAAYVYDAEGRRVKKTTAAGAVYFMYDLAGRQSNELSSSGGLNRSEVYAGGHHVATYTGGTTYFDHADWLGTERARSGISGSICESITSLPFGDGQTTSGGCGDASPLHYTGKQRDTESGLDDFDARYYSSTMGRFISADWSAVPEPVPYAHLSNPQTLNLYAIVSDNVESFADLDGHDYLVHGLLNFYAPDWNSMNELAHYDWPGSEVIGNSKSLSGDITYYNDIIASYKYFDPAKEAAAAAQQQNSSSGPARTPGTGNPNTTVRFPGNKPGTATDREYGPDGKAVKDIDYGHNHPPNYPGDPHAHDWDWNKKKPLQPGRPIGPEDVVKGLSMWAADHKIQALVGGIILAGVIATVVIPMVAAPAALAF